MSTSKLRYGVFASGASVMMVEILGSRIIAPYYGSSTYVWSALIGVILASLSLGYHYGGRLADREPSESKLSLLLLTCSVLVFLIPLVGDIALAFTTFAGLKAGAILAPLLLLSSPSFLLGMVSPYAVRLSAKKIQSVGSTAGDLYALSTVGSIAGTFAVGFILIPYMKISSIFFFVSLLLLSASVILNYGEKRFEQQYMAILLVLFLLSFTPMYLGGKKLLYMAYTPYSQLIVDEDSENRYMLQDMAVNGGIILRTGYSLYEYADYFELPFLMKPDIKSVLIGGEGTGVGARQIQANHPDADILMAEIDPGVREAARRFFLIEENDRLRVEINDVRLVAKSSERKYDYVIMDVFNSRFSVPYHVLTREFFSEAGRAMKPDGIILINVISYLEGPKSLVLQSVARTLREQFPYVNVYPVQKNTDGLSNIILIASKKPLPTSQELSKLASDTKVIPKARLQYMANRSMEYSAGQGVLLTDDYAPVDHLYMKMLE